METATLSLFSSQDGRDLSWVAFENHILGKLYSTIPFQEYTSVIPYEVPKTGPRPWFSLEGGIALQVLKSYYGNSDEKLIDQLNENKMMQYFCGINLKLGEKIRDAGVVSRWRILLGEYLESVEICSKVQKVNAISWQKDIEDKKTSLADATCYESYVRYPTAKG